MALTTNLVPNPSFKNGTTSWAATGGSTTIAASTTGGYYGNYCLTVTKAAAANVGAVTDTTTITVTVGNTYAASAYIKVPTGEETGSFKVGIGFYTSGNSLIGSIQYSATATSITATSGWVRVSHLYVAPATSSYAKIYVVQSTTATAAETFLIDAVQFENSYDPTPFIETLTQGQETAAVNDGLRPVPTPHLTGMELNGDIMLNDLLLNTVDYNKCVWVCTGIDGWWGVPDPEVPELTRGLDDGSYDVRGRWTARDMTLTGTILVPSRDYAEVARQRLIEAISLVHSGGWLFVGENPTKAAYVRLSGRPEIENVNARGRMNFSVGLRAANPVKFSWNWNDQNGYESANVTAGGSTSYTNDGNIDVPTVLSLEGPLTAPITIANGSSQSLKIVKSLRAAGNVKTVTNAVQSGTSVTLTVGASHGFVQGDVINVNDVTTVGYTDLNNDNAVTLTSVDSTTISYTSGTSRTLTSAACNGNVIRDHAKAIANATQSTTTVTLTLASGHSFLAGDVVSVSGVSTVGYTGLNSDDSVTITAVTSTTISYTSGTSRTLTTAACNGYLYLDSKDTLVIDTYNKSALFRGSAGIARSYIDAVVDWITLAPGSNTITFTPTSGTTQLNVKHRSGWIG